MYSYYKDEQLVVWGKSFLVKLSGVISKTYSMYGVTIQEPLDTVKHGGGSIMKGCVRFMKAIKSWFRGMQIKLWEVSVVFMFIFCISVCWNIRLNM